MFFDPDRQSNYKIIIIMIIDYNNRYYICFYNELWRKCLGLESVLVVWKDWRLSNQIGPVTISYCIMLIAE